ncbi:MAG TPA: T9SS type A sorting domain-containing protein [Chitinophagaceae bacterium]|nr:T9SS type A sorting domain-containing protein [Chitinophagaceae bacterium]
MKKIYYIFIFTVLFNLGSLAQGKIVAGASESAVKFMRFYPNPAVSVINFEFQKGFDKYFTFQVFNFIGKKVVDLKSVTQKINIPLTDFYRGVYIYQLRDRSGKIIDSGKFQVVK